MNKIFKKNFEVFAKRTLNQKDSIDTLPQEIRKFKRGKDIRNGNILYRFPKKELRHFLRLECPTEVPAGKKDIKSYEVIQAAKRLRSFMNIPENFVCTRCSKKDTCKFRDIIPPEQNTSVSDLLVVMNGLYNYHLHVYGDTRPKPTELTESQLEGPEEDLFAEAEEGVPKEEEEHTTNEDENEVPPELLHEEEAETGKNVNDRYSFKTWNSGLKVIDTLYPIMEDIKLRRGGLCKQYINTYIAEQKRLKETNSNEASEEEDEGEVQEPRQHQNRSNRFKKFSETRDNKRRERGVQNEPRDVSWGTKPQRVPKNQSEESFDQEEAEINEVEEDENIDEFKTERTMKNNKRDNRSQNMTDARTTQNNEHNKRPENRPNRSPKNNTRNEEEEFENEEEEDDHQEFGDESWAVRKNQKKMQRGDYNNSANPNQRSNNKFSNKPRSVQRSEGKFENYRGNQRSERKFENNRGYQRSEGKFENNRGYQRSEGKFENNRGYQRSEGKFENNRGYQKSKGGFDKKTKSQEDRRENQEERRTTPKKFDKSDKNNQAPRRPAKKNNDNKPDLSAFLHDVKV